MLASPDRKDLYSSRTRSAVYLGGGSFFYAQNQRKRMCCQEPDSESGSLGCEWSGTEESERVMSPNSLNLAFS